MLTLSQTFYTKGWKRLTLKILILSKTDCVQLYHCEDVNKEYLYDAVNEQHKE